MVTMHGPRGRSEKSAGEPTSQLIHLSVGGIDHQHVGGFVTQGHYGSREGQGSPRLLVFALLIHKILQDARLKVQHKVPAEKPQSVIFSSVAHISQQSRKLSLKSTSRDSGRRKPKVPPGTPQKSAPEQGESPGF